MSEAAPSKNVATLSFASPRRVRFVDKISGNDAVLMSFKDPVPCFAILGDAPVAAKRAAATEPHGEELEIDLLILPTLTQGSPLATDRRDAVWMERGDDRDAPPPVFIKARGAELTWRPGRALLQCDSEQAETLLAGARLENLWQHDPLGLDKEMEYLQDAAKDGRVQQIVAIKEILERLEEDPGVLDRVRKRARLLLASGER